MEKRGKLRSFDRQ